MRSTLLFVAVLLACGSMQAQTLAPWCVVFVQSETSALQTFSLTQHHGRAPLAAASFNLQRQLAISAVLSETKFHRDREVDVLSDVSVLSHSPNAP